VPVSWFGNPFNCSYLLNCKADWEDFLSDTKIEKSPAGVQLSANQAVKCAER